MNPKEALVVISKFFQQNSWEDFEFVLDDLLTPEEIITIYERIMILQSLKDGLTQREIAKKLWVSSWTVSRGSRILQYGKREGNFKF